MRRYIMLLGAFVLGGVLGATAIMLLQPASSKAGCLPVAPSNVEQAVQLSLMAEVRAPFTDVVHWYADALDTTPSVEFPRFAMTGTVGNIGVHIRGQYTQGKTIVAMHGETRENEP